MRRSWLRARRIRLGIARVRLTGRALCAAAGLANCVLARQGLGDLAMTTNGICCSEASASLPPVCGA
jgi:hypothetical protein